MKVLGLLEPALQATLTPSLAQHGVHLSAAPKRPEAVLTALGSVHDEDARRAATAAHIPVVWIVNPQEVARSDSRLPANAHFVVEPVKPEELAARLRRAVELDAVTLLDLGDRRIDLESGEVTVGDQTVRLTATEVRLLRVLVAAEDRVLSRAELLRRVWGYRGGTSTRALDIAVRRLRTKIEPLPSSPVHLLTVVRTGYRLALHEGQAERGGRRAGLAQTLRPDEVPVSDTPFCGRATEQAALLRLLTPPGARVSLVAPPGMGKKRLALEALAQHDGPVWRVRVPADPEDLSAAVLRVSGLGSRRTLADALEVLARTPEAVLWLVGHPAPQADCLSLLQALAEAAPQTRVLYTGPRPLGLPAERALPLGPLSLDASGTLLATLWERQAPFAEPLSDDDPGLRALHDLSGGVPLALEWMGAGFTTRSPAEVARTWTHASAQGKLHDVLSPMWTALRAPLQRGLMGLGQLNGSVSPEGAEHVLRHLLGEEATEVLRALVSRALVQRQPTPHGTRLWIPQPLVAFLRGVDRPREQAEARDAVDAWCVHLGESKTLHRLRRPEGAGWMVELRTRAKDLERAVRGGRLDGRQTLNILRALFGLAVYDTAVCPLDELLDQLDPGLTFQPVERAELQYLVLEDSLGRQPAPPPETLNDAIATAQAAGHADLEASLRISAGYLSLAASDPDLASRHAEAALALVDRLTPWNRVNVLGFAVGPRVSTSERPEVQAALLRHMQERREANDHLTVARNSGWVAQPHWRAGRFDEALDALVAGIEAARALTDHVAEARELGNEATVRFILDDIPGALAAQERALGLMRQLGMQQGLTTDLSTYAELLHVVGEPERSRQHIREALAAARTEMLPRYRWIAWRSAAKLHLARGEWSAAEAAAAEGVVACGIPDGRLALELRLLGALARAASGAPPDEAEDLEDAEAIYAGLRDRNARLRIAGLRARLEALDANAEGIWATRYAEARKPLVRTHRRDVVALDRLLAGALSAENLDLI